MEETDLKTLQQLPTGLLIGSVANFEITGRLTVLAGLSSDHTGSCRYGAIFRIREYFAQVNLIRNQLFCSNS